MQRNRWTNVHVNKIERYTFTDKVCCQGSVPGQRSYSREKEGIPMFWGFHGLLFLLPLLFLGKFFWIVILALLIGVMVRRFSWRNRPMPFYGQGPYYRPGVPPVQPSAMEILQQRYARGEI